MCYYTMKAPEGREWCLAWQWPLAQQQSRNYYFHGGPSRSVNSENDGLLIPFPPECADGQDEYTVDYTTTSGKATRWTNGYGGEFGYGDMTANDERALTYTTTVLRAPLQITGHPVIHLWVRSTSSDGDFFVYLEEVDRNRVSHYVTEGTLRASHRALARPPFDNVGLPYHPSLVEHAVELPCMPVKLSFDLHPTSYFFSAGHRLRITITGADKDNAFTQTLSPPPVVTVYRNVQYASYITLPIIPLT
jgi:putative CocE/NonD family hydrolase